MSKTIMLSRVICFAIILTALAYFNVKAGQYEEIREKNSETINRTKVQSVGNYKDGTYQGTGIGYGGPVTAELQVEKGHIKEMKIISAEKEDAAYYNMAIAVAERIVASDSPQVEAISGATFTSNGIKKAAEDALSKAEGSDEAVEK
ncbi:MAG: FMN-binding protein [Anaerovoracaceae bacterium]